MPKKKLTKNIWKIMLKSKSAVSSVNLAVRSSMAKFMLRARKIWATEFNASAVFMQYTTCLCQDKYSCVFLTRSSNLVRKLPKFSLRINIWSCCASIWSKIICFLNALTGANLKSSPKSDCARLLMTSLTFFRRSR